MAGPLQNPFMFKSAAGATGFYTHQIANSVRMIMADGSRLRYTPSSAGNRTTWSISMWVKRAKLGDEQFLYEAGASGDADTRLRLVFTDDDKIMVGTGNANLVTSTAVFRDPSAYYHIMWKNASNTNTVHVNGVQATTVTISGNTAINSTVVHGLGCRGASGDDTSSSLDGYIAEFVLFDGTAYDYTDVTDSKNGVLIPVDPSGLTLSGTNTAWLKFQTAADIDDDSSGNTNDYTASNIATHDQMLDSPTFGSSSSGNFCTMNPLFKTPDVTFSEGNLAMTNTTNNRGCMGNFAVPSTGKWYWEYRCTTIAEGHQYRVGINYEDNDFTANERGNSAEGVNYDSYDGNKRVDNGTSASYGASYTTTDVIGVAVDRSANTIQFYKNNSAQGTIDISGLQQSKFFPFAGHGGGTASQTIKFNFGADSSFSGSGTAGSGVDSNGYGNFVYTPPTDFLALCSGNLPTAAAVDPAETDDDYPQKLFNTKLYTGTGSSNALTGVGFQPDLTWIKERGAANDHKLTDSTRGVTKSIESNEKGAQATDTNGLTAFGADGFTVGTDVVYNNSSDTYASWNWRVNGGTTSSNSNGSVTSTVQVDPSGAFSIVTFRGGLTGAGAATIGHGLSKAPVMIIFKGYANLGGGDGNWWVGSDGLTSWNYLLRLDTTDVELDKSGNGSMASPTSTVFSVNNTDGLGAGSIDTIAYCFTNVEGYCKTGGYIGNGNADGAFVYTGHRPAWLMIKATDVVDSWFLLDTARDPSNEAVIYLQPNSSAADGEHANIGINILSNGFKCTRASNALNGSGNDYVYLSMSHNPFQYATAR